MTLYGYVEKFIQTIPGQNTWDLAGYLVGKASDQFPVGHKIYLPPKCLESEHLAPRGGEGRNLCRRPSLAILRGSNPAFSHFPAKWLNARFEPRKIATEPRNLATEFFFS